jgi:hypothetical protein
VIIRTAVAAAALIFMTAGTAAAQDSGRGRAVRPGLAPGGQAAPGPNPAAKPSPNAQAPGAAASPEAKAAAAREADDRQADEARKRTEAKLARRELEMKKVMRGICSGC